MGIGRIALVAKPGVLHVDVRQIVAALAAMAMSQLRMQNYPGSTIGHTRITPIIRSQTKKRCSRMPKHPTTRSFLPMTASCR